MATTVEKESTGFTIGQQVSMFITVEASIFSGIATLGLLSYKLFLFLRRSFRKQLEKREEDACDSSLFISLMVGEVLRSIGATMTLRWVLDGSITHDTFCVAQGYIKLIGTNAIDFTTLAITVQTFCILILRWKAPKHLAKFFTMAVWTVVLLITVISFAVHRNDLMGPTNFWCWIPRKHRVTQIMAEYIWMWTIGVVTAILYGLGYFVVRGKLTLGRNRTGDHLGMDAEDDQELRQMANQLLVYPIVYLICITPQSFSRWFYFSHFEVPYQFTLFARTLFSLSGLFNVVLFFTTRYELVVGSSASEDQTTDEEDAGQAINVSSDNAGEHGRLPQIPEKEDDQPNKGPWGTGWTRETMDPSPYEDNRGRRHAPEPSGSSSARHPSSSAHRTLRTEDDEDDFGQLPS